MFWTNVVFLTNLCSMTGVGRNKQKFARNIFAEKQFRIHLNLCVEVEFCMLGA